MTGHLNGTAGSRLIALLALPTLILCCSPADRPGSTASDTTSERTERIFVLAAEVERRASEQTLWPGFNPLAVPLAVYDGEGTWLFRHPAPPQGFNEVAGASPRAFVFDGRLAEVTANSSATIGGVTTATLLLDPWPEDRPLGDLAALTLHESFHVYQRENHPDWIADEASLFTYPCDDLNVLTLLRSEVLALRRAIEAEDDETAACWSRLALTYRNSRFSFFEQTGNDPAPAAYERGTELNEGLAAYVEYRAAKRKRPERLYAAYGPEDVRRRAYATGLALALLLDRLSPGWREDLNAGTYRHLDTALNAAIGPDASPIACAFTDAEKQEILAGAMADLTKLGEERERLRAEFDAAPGWRLVIEAENGQPLMLAGFDPINVRLVGGGVLHTRYIKLGNDAGSVEMMGGRALTESAGSHPLYEGVTRLVQTGLEAAPDTVVEGETVSITTPTLTAAFDGARVESAGSAVIVRLPPAGEPPR